jgi:hypothetical protein
MQVDVTEPVEMLPYNVFGDFGLYIRDGIDDALFDEQELTKIFCFLNEMGDSNDMNTHNLLTVGTLKILTDSKMRLKLLGIN